MTPEDLQKVRHVFDAAVQLPRSERLDFAREAAQGDAALFQQVADLLKAHEHADSLLRTGAISAARILDDVEMRAGHVVGGRFEVLRLLGKGGMGRVYQSHDRALDRTVALKVLPGDLADDTVFRQRLRREARALA